ncbi:MAG: fumarylacetoacetate hydrolase family protein [Porticoccaceae bacterium]|nr:fumarylacetoacetate hydrolase family protein [Porticoccaceae bacterium]MBT6422198.1 fumarylacetoacetate hydrolase family protein [Porticoccaceae bacterium]MBT6691956.1 fumarylacetoacetate hydrolase family protein [Porticoccaceae bacterium]
MRFLTFERSGQVSWGVITEEGIIDLGFRVGGDLHSILKDGRVQEMQVLAKDMAADFSSDDVRFLPPIIAPEKIACVGVNYANRNAEYKDGSEQPKFPSLFMRTPDSLTGHNQPLQRPPETPQLDYEGEIVIIIGKGGRRIDVEDAYDHIGGLSIMNEGTLRDWVRHAKFNVTQGKNFVHSGAIGPWIVTADEFSHEQLENMRVTTRVNGEVRQDDTTASMMFPFRYIISYFSTFFHLKPGDVIATGTPNGAGARFDPPIWLVPGDIVEVEVEGVGLLSNGVMDELV